MSNVRNRHFSFYEVIVDGKALFQEFSDSLIQKRDRNSLASIYAMMDRLSDNLLQSTLINHISGSKSDRNDVYEFKKNNLRVYFILQRPDVLILLGGYKAKQKKDIASVFRKFNQLPPSIPDYEQR